VTAVDSRREVASSVASRRLPEWAVVRVHPFVAVAVLLVVVMLWTAVAVVAVLGA
jgi:hypothetical protein